MFWNTNFTFKEKDALRDHVELYESNIFLLRTMTASKGFLFENVSFVFQEKVVDDIQ